MQADIKSFEEAHIAVGVNVANSTKTPGDRVNRAETIFDRAMKSASGIKTPRTG